LIGHTFARTIFALAFVISTVSGASAEGPPPAQTIHLTNGASATTFTHCGDLDLCARISYNDGSVLSVYSEGAVECQPYLLHFVFVDNSGKTLFEFSRAINHTHAKDSGCGHTVATEMVLDRGYVHMLLTENSDGTLDAKFSVAK
jgi:hypothetical protein